MEAHGGRRAEARPWTGILGLAGIAAVLVFGLAVTNFGGGRSVGLDLPWHDFLARQQSVVADAIAQWIEVVGGTLAMSIVTAIIVVALLFARRWRPAMIIGVSVGLSFPVASLIKVLVALPRPVDQTLDLTTFTYPSGHTTTAAAFAVAIALSFPRVWTWVAAVAWVLLVGISRNYLLVHWLSDAVAGAVLGASIAVAVAAVVALVRRRSSLSG